ncbi:MAG: zf-TFIIB domain-containing protein [Dehalococcoidia bacterium]
MKCPTCQVELRMTDRQGIEIDYCPQCRGVWLDRGELDKLIERSAEARPAESRNERAPMREYPPAVVYRDDDYYRRDDDYYRKRKRKGFLGDLFDFD